VNQKGAGKEGAGEEQERSRKRSDQHKFPKAARQQLQIAAFLGLQPISPSAAEIVEFFGVHPQRKQMCCFFNPPKFAERPPLRSKFNNHSKRVHCSIGCSNLCWPNAGQSGAKCTLTNHFFEKSRGMFRRNLVDADAFPRYKHLCKLPQTLWGFVLDGIHHHCCPGSACPAGSALLACKV